MASEIAARFGANLRRHRRRAGLTQERLGFAAGLHRTEIHVLEHGQRVPRIDTLVKIACALTVPADALLDGIAWEGPEAAATPGQFRVTGAIAFTKGAGSMDPAH